MDALSRRHTAGHKRRQVTGQQRRGEDGAHRRELHAEKRGRQGRTKQAGEHSAHARHGQHGLLVLVQPQQPPQLGRHTAAQLQRRPFPSGGAAEKVSDGGGQEDHRGDQAVDAFAVQDGIDDLIGAPVPPELKQVVQAHAGQAAQGQQENDPGVFRPDFRDEVQGVVKKRPEEATDGAHQRPQQAPFQEYLPIFLRVVYLVQPGHNIASFLFDGDILADITGNGNGSSMFSGQITDLRHQVHTNRQSVTESDLLVLEA